MDRQARIADLADAYARAQARAAQSEHARAHPPADAVAIDRLRLALAYHRDTAEAIEAALELFAAINQRRD